MVPSVAEPDSPRKRSPQQRRITELAKFGTIGAIAFAVDLGLFNVLRFWWSDSPIGHKPITCRVVSVTVATTVSYLGNRWWTWRRHASRSIGREYAAFFAVNAVALLLGAAFLAVSNYLLGLHSLVADNTANVLSVIAGTAFRFWAYRKFVFAGVSG